MPQMQRVIFYSWQADLPNNTNRGFIQGALEHAANAITADLDVQPVIERDTQGVPGSPDIAKTIFRKIGASDVFVADITLINPSSSERRTPNPNVLLELGYAMHALGDDRIILVMNTAYGRIEELPFDLKMRRAIPFSVISEETHKSTERRRLAAVLQDAIIAAIASIPAPAPTPSAVDAAIVGIEAAAPNRTLLTRRAMAETTRQLEQTAPPRFRDGGTDEQLVNAIGQTIPSVKDFTRLSRAIAGMNDSESARALYKSFSLIFDRFANPRGFTGSSDRRDFDYWKFLGHELLVTFTSALLTEERYDLLAELLEETITITNPRHGSGPAAVTFAFASKYLEGLEQLSKARHRMSYHTDLLKERHTGPLAEDVSLEDFLSADYFLHLRTELAPETPPKDFFEWKAWSTLALEDAPSFLLAAQRATTAAAVAKALGVTDAATLKTRLAQRANRLAQLWNGRWDSPIRQEHIDRIATR